MALYGGPRRFALVNIPAFFLFLVSDLFGSMRTLLSLDPLQPLVRQFRLDGVYAVRGLKRHYIDAPLSSTFIYPGDWAYDPSVEMARSQRSDPAAMTYARRSQPPQASSPLPLVALGPVAGAGSKGLSLALYARPAGRARSLAEAVGTPEEALASIMGQFAASAPRLKGRAPVGEQLAAEALPAPPAPGGREAYQLASRVRFEGDGEDQGLQVWTKVQLVPGSAATKGAVEPGSADQVTPSSLSSGAAAGTAKLRQSYLLLLTGVAPASAPQEEIARVRSAVESLEFLPEKG